MVTSDSYRSFIQVSHPTCICSLTGFTEGPTPMHGPFFLGSLGAVVVRVVSNEVYPSFKGAGPPGDPSQIRLLRAKFHWRTHPQSVTNYGFELFLCLARCSRKWGGPTPLSHQQSFGFGLAWRSGVQVSGASRCPTSIWSFKRFTGCPSPV